MTSPVDYLTNPARRQQRIVPTISGWTRESRVNDNRFSYRYQVPGGRLYTISPTEHSYYLRAVPKAFLNDDELSNETIRRALMDAPAPVAFILPSGEQRDSETMHLAQAAVYHLPQSAAASANLHALRYGIG